MRPGDSVNAAGHCLKVVDTYRGPYEVTAQIGVGGMGEVFQATDTKLKRRVAIKVLPESVAADSDRLARFQPKCWPRNPLSGKCRLISRLRQRCRAVCTRWLAARSVRLGDRVLGRKDPSAPGAIRQRDVHGHR